jgi:hypothetical protein
MSSGTAKRDMLLIAAAYECLAAHAEQDAERNRDRG